MKVALNYPSFAGNKTTFRAEDMENALNAIEQGFKREIRKLLSSTLRTQSSYIPINKNTAAHMCSLFSLSLQKKGLRNLRLYSIYKKCKRRFTHLELIDIEQPRSIKINWKDPCFYSKYWNILKNSEIII